MLSLEGRAADVIWVGGGGDVYSKKHTYHWAISLQSNRNCPVTETAWWEAAQLRIQSSQVKLDLLTLCVSDPFPLTCMCVLPHACLALAEVRKGHWGYTWL